MLLATYKGKSKKGEEQYVKSIHSYINLISQSYEKYLNPKVPEREFRHL